MMNDANKSKKEKYKLLNKEVKKASKKHKKKNFERKIILQIEKEDFQQKNLFNLFKSVQLF